MKKLANTAPALFCLVSLIYPVGARLARLNGALPAALPTHVFFPAISILSVLLAAMWFCFSFDNRNSVRGIHVLLGIFAPTLAAINGLCFMLTDATFWPCIHALVMWFSSLLIPIGCNDLRLGKGFRGILTMAPGVCVMIFAFIFILSDSLL